MLNKGCSDEEIQIIHCGCEPLNLEGLEYCPKQVLIVGVSGMEAVVNKATEEIKKTIEDVNSSVPANAFKGLIEEINKIKNFKEKPQKRNFVNKFNKNQHRK